MSTDLYRVRVLALEPEQRKVIFRVFLVYYDWSGVPTDPSFFLRILWDEADTRFGGGGPLGEEVSVDNYLNESWVNENTQRFVERVTRLSLRNDPLPPGEEPPTFVYEGFNNEDALTQGDYEVIVTDARWLAHLKVGQTWQTTSYETKAKMPKDRKTVLLDAKPAPEKKVAAKRAATKVTAPAKKPAAKQAATKVTAPAKKPAAKQAATKVTAPAKKPAAKQAVTKNTALTKPTAKTAATKKAAPAKKSAPKKR